MIHTSHMFQKQIHKVKFTQLLMILHKRCLWCLWQISCLNRQVVRAAKEGIQKVYSRSKSKVLCFIGGRSSPSVSKIILIYIFDYKIPSKLKAFAAHQSDTKVGTLQMRRSKCVTSQIDWTVNRILSVILLVYFQTWN